MSDHITQSLKNQAAEQGAVVVTPKSPVVSKTLITNALATISVVAFALMGSDVIKEYPATVVTLIASVYGVANAILRVLTTSPLTIHPMADSTKIMLALGFCLLPAAGYAQDGVTDRGPLTAEWSAGENPKVVLIDGQGEVVKPAEKPKSHKRRELTHKQRTSLGLTIPQLKDTVKRLHDEGAVDEETSISEIAVLVLEDRSKSHAGALEGIDFESILAWLELILPLILAALGL